MAYIELETAIKVLRGKAIAKYPASFYMGFLAASNELNNITRNNNKVTLYCYIYRYNVILYIYINK